MLGDAGAENAPELGVGALADEVEVELAEGWREPVRVLLFPLAFVVAEANSVARVARRDHDLEQPGGVQPAHRRDPSRPRDVCGACLRVKRPDPHLVPCATGSEERVWVVEATGKHQLHGHLELRCGAIAGAHWLVPRSRKRIGMGTQLGR